VGRYIDLHLHLLPKVDDGPASDEESVELARLIVSTGVGDATVTPHFNAWNPNVLSSKAELEDRVVQLRTLLSEHDIPLNVFPGAEHFLTPELLTQVREGTAPLLASGPYVLVELPFDNRPLYADELLYQLGLEGVQPVLAHPERYRWAHDAPDLLEAFTSRGTVLQLTAGSLLGGYGSRVKKVADYLLRNRYYSLVGSDLHHPGQERLLPVMETAVAQAVGIEAADVLFGDNPARVLEGKPLLEVPVVEAESQQKRLFGFFG
jgi:protein-tyrosine phosphatase